MATAQAKNARGAAVPSCFDIVAGRVKMLAPMVVLMMFAAKPGTPMARTSCASALPGSSFVMRTSLGILRLRNKVLWHDASEKCWAKRRNLVEGHRMRASHLED